MGGSKMSNCDSCAFRAKYDKNPQSFLGKLWKWHIRWCPGWKSHLRSLPEEKREEILKRYREETVRLITA
jgi:hypothetical protein